MCSKACSFLDHRAGFNNRSDVTLLKGVSLMNDKMTDIVEIVGLALLQAPETAQLNVPDKLHRMSPRQKTIYIKKQWTAAVDKLLRRTEDPNSVLLQYIDDMEHLHSSSLTPLNSLHISTMIYGLARIWLSAAKGHHHWQQSVICPCE